MPCFEELSEAGVDVMTMGDHIYRKDEIFQVFDRTAIVLRPANFPPDSPGPELALATARDGTRIAVFSLIGRTFMNPADSPFRTADRLIDQIGADIPVRIVDVHAEATGEKQLLAHTWTAGSRPCSAPTPTSQPPTSTSRKTGPPIKPTWA